MLKRKGATFVEYALLAGLVAVIVAVAAYAFGGKIKDLFAETGKTVDNTKGVVEKANKNIK